MNLIAGLGNPGGNYLNSRHNVGFLCVDRLAQQVNSELTQKKFHGLFAQTFLDDRKVMLLKPQTYMNRSGLSVAETVNFYQLPLEQILVIVDDAALELGRLRLRPGGSSGGHNGLKDIAARLGTDRFPRFRIGIGAAAHNMVSHVLGPFSRQEAGIVSDVLDRACQAARHWLTHGIASAMNAFNAPNEKT